MDGTWESFPARSSFARVKFRKKSGVLEQVGGMEMFSHGTGSLKSEVCRHVPASYREKLHSKEMLVGQPPYPKPTIV